MSEDDDLEVLRQGRPEPQEQQLKEALERDVKSTEPRHLRRHARGHYFMQIELTHPTASVSCPALRPDAKWSAAVRE